MPQSILASVKKEEVIADGVKFQGDFNTIWVGVTGNIATSRDNGQSYIVYENVPVGFHNVKGNIIGASADGTTATKLLACKWN